MKNKFSLRNPKYGLPLILLPFLLLTAFAISLFFPKQSDQSVAQTKKIDGINSNLPDPALSTQKDKFELLQELLQRRKAESGLEGINDDLKLFNPDDEELFERDLLSLIDPVSDTLKIDETQIRTDSEDALRELQKRFFPDEPSIFDDNLYRTPQPRSQQADELAQIRQQLALMDSMLRAQGNKPDDAKRTIEDEAQKILDAQKADIRKTNTFNTLTGDKKRSFITAILDEAQTVVAGSRIRIRLLDDIFIGDYLFTRGSYLYGLVSGFSAQRVNVDITTVLYGDRILKTRLSIYDNDGIKGLYVPNSDFREMMQMAGSQMVQSSNVSINNNQNMMQQMATQAGTDFYRSVTRAISQKIRQNKAKLKYSSQIFLINEDNNQNF